MDLGYLLLPLVTPLWKYFTTAEATRLRRVCRTARESVAECRWADKKTRIAGSIAAWRACFPAAVAANVCDKMNLCDADFVHLRGIHTLDMSWCRQPSITDAAFVHLRGIHTLDMGNCSQPSITDAAFVHLRGIHTLDMSGCGQPSITDAAFVHLRGIHTLAMWSCDQPGIMDGPLLAALQNGGARVT
jgi:hypothetical protein